MRPSPRNSSPARSVQSFIDATEAGPVLGCTRNKRHKGAGVLVGEKQVTSKVCSVLLVQALETDEQGRDAWWSDAPPVSQRVAAGDFTCCLLFRVPALPRGPGWLRESGFPSVNAGVFSGFLKTLSCSVSRPLVTRANAGSHWPRSIALTLLGDLVRQVLLVRFTNEEREAERGCHGPRAHSRSVAEPGLEPRLSAPTVHTLTTAPV